MAFRPTKPMVGRLTKMRMLPPTSERGHLREKTYTGVATAMARQFALSVFIRLARPEGGLSRLRTDSPRRVRKLFEDRLEWSRLQQSLSEVGQVFISKINEEGKIVVLARRMNGEEGPDIEEDAQGIGGSKAKEDSDFSTVIEAELRKSR